MTQDASQEPSKPAVEVSEQQTPTALREAEAKAKNNASKKTVRNEKPAEPSSEQQVIHSQNASDAFPSHIKLRNYLIAFSLLWVLFLATFAYFYAFYGSDLSLSAAIGQWQIIVFASLVIVPILALWLPYYFLRAESEAQANQRREIQALEQKTLDNQTQSINALRKDIADIRRQLDRSSKTQEKLLSELIPMIGTQASISFRNRAKKSSESEEAHLSPKLPLSEKRNKEITLDDLSHVLNFSDRDKRGDWANAFSRIQDNGKYLEFVRNAENVLEIFEQEGIYVEDISLRTAPGEVWRLFAQGVRGEQVSDLEGIKDPSVLALIRARLRNDTQFQDLALRYQKRFIQMLEDHADDALEVDFVKLNLTRGGRVFVIFGALSGIFG